MISTTAKRKTSSLYCRTEHFPAAYNVRHYATPINEQSRDKKPSVCDDDVFKNDEICYRKQKGEGCIIGFLGHHDDCTM
jgi:hypothetical protein